MGDDYVLKREIGQGSYGTVVQAKHLPTKRDVAIKKVSNIFNHPVDAKRLLREIQILRKMGRHRNVVKLYDVLEPSRSPETFTDLYYVFEQQHSDLLTMMAQKAQLGELHI